MHASRACAKRLLVAGGGSGPVLRGEDGGRLTSLARRCCLGIGAVARSESQEGMERFVAHATVTSQLDRARCLLAELGLNLEALTSSKPDAFSDPKVTTRLEAFRRAHEEATRRLAMPALSIATIGTTSSGKSTLVNALTGRRVAPMDAGEMSAGVLVLRHASRRRLRVEATHGARWTVGEWADFDERHIYDRVRDEVMRRYHQERKNHDCAAPQVTIEGPLLPVMEPDLLGLPEGVDVEFIDLPGLKSVQDRSNLAVIQSRVHKAFSLVTLDYWQTDDDNRRRLLEELRRVVDYLHGRTDSMIFVLNRVDARSRDDVPLSERLRTLQSEIQHALSLEEAPDVLPMCARLLYHAQCAWGPTPLTAEPTTPPSERIERIKALFTECAPTLELESDRDAAVEAWLTDLKRQARSTGEVPTADLRKLVRLARNWSGGDALWSRLRDRVAESFAELVILPALIELFDAYDALDAALRTLASVRQLQSREEVQAKRHQLTRLREKLAREVNATRERFCKRLMSAVDKLKARTPELQHQAVQELGPGFGVLVDAVGTIKADLNVNVITAVRDALKSERPTFELDEKLRTYLDPNRARRLAEAYDRFSRTLHQKLRQTPEGLEFKVRADDPEKDVQLDQVERDAKRLFQAVRDGLAACAEYQLQGVARKFTDALSEALGAQTAELGDLVRREIAEVGLEGDHWGVAVGRIRAEQLQLPEKLFALPEPAARTTRVIREKTGERVEREESGTCFTQTREVRKDVFDDVSYDVLVLPDVDGMAQRWASAVDETEATLWDTLAGWMTRALTDSARMFEESVGALLELAERALEEHLAALETRFRAEIDTWSFFERDLLRLRAVRTQLYANAVSRRRKPNEEH
ncbi:MAG: dynamin family protein [Myxococcales bacterium]|nr:dynamin family protein [Myxococcales bacterium]